jgi:hypothetical protein
MGLLELLIPEDTTFFDLCERQEGRGTEAARRLVVLSKDFTGVREKRHAIETPGHTGDQIAHDICEQLNSTFVTPIDPGELSRLVSPRDEVLDYIDRSDEKMLSYSIESDTGEDVANTLSDIAIRHP